MTRFVRWMIVPVVAVLAACGGQSDSERLDEALTRDLALAASMQYPQQQFMSPMEMGYAQPYGQPQQQVLYDQYGRPVYAPQPVAQQAIYRAPAPAPARTTARASTGTTVRREPIRNTKRDALIGATAGAVIGSVISKDVKGALIGAAAGGLLGGVVGHTIDVQH
ncbi:MAG TPA: YMGG-like glycine zipper-containing protein [Gemmatimonadaceae bacterium]|nr:YMGG-like glycine zipper-containing protein [Gemmatimonadaceae bacterium]